MNNICDDLQNIILDFIPNYPKYLSNCQLVCKRWKHVLLNRLDTVYWNKVEEIIGKKGTDKLKQGLGESMLFIAVKQNKVKRTKFLLSIKNINPNLTDKYGESPLWMAVNLHL